MVNIIKEEIILDESLKKKIEFICEFAKVKPTIINGSIRKIYNTNLTYIETHKIIEIFQKIYILMEYLVIRLLNQFKTTIFGIKKMIKTKEKMITKSGCDMNPVSWTK